MKKIYLFLFLLINIFIFSQCNCAKNFGGWVDDSVINIKDSKDGFLFSYYDQLGDWPNFPAGERMIKFDYNCNLIWEKYLPNDTFNVDNDGNIYTIKQYGYYQNYYVLFRKYDSNANLVWEKKFIGDIQGGNILKYIFIHNQNIYIVANFWYDLNFENKIIFHYPYQHFGGNKTKAFVAKYDNNGNFIDAKEFGNGTTEIFNDYETDPDENIYLSMYDSNLDFSKIYKIDSNLNLLISKQIATEGTNSWGYVPTKLHYHKKTNRLFAYGTYYNTTNVDGTVITDNSNSTQGLITEFDPVKLSLNRYLKVNNNCRLDIPNDGGNNNPLTLNRYHFADEDTDELFVFGSFNGKMSIDNKIIESTKSIYGQYNDDLILFKINLNTFLPVYLTNSKTLSQYGSLNSAKQMFLKKGNLYLTANFTSNPIEINNTIITNNSGNGDVDAMLYKFSTNKSGSLSSNSPVCPKTDIKLTASGGTSYSWTGPNGFTSTDQNPIIPNATYANSGTYSCTISGTGDCDGTYTVEVKVEDKTPPNPDITNLPDITGDCHTVISTTPTATDNCSGKITATTTDALQYSIPGTYTITWKYDDGNGNTFSQTQKVIITSPALPTATSPQTFCAIDAPKISNISISGQNIIWYDDSGNVLNTATPLIDGTTYYASQTINDCESDKIAIQVKVNVTPLPTGNTNQDFCTSRNAQIKDLAVTGTSLKFYDNLGNLLPNTTVLQNNTSYFITQTLNNCESPKLEIKVTLTANSLPANDYQLTFCNDTTANSKTEDLRKYQENIISGSSAYSFEYFDQNNNPISDFANRNLIIGFNIFNVKVKSADGCWKMVQLKLQLNPKPVANLPANAEFCRGLSVNLDAGSGFKSYVWTKEGTPTPISNAQILNVSEAGKYTVEVTNSSDCKNTSSTQVNQSILANILKVEITNNDAKVLLSANGDFVYSLDNSNWQNKPEFTNLNNGSYTVYVKTKLGCIIGEMNFTIFNIPNAFTPNSDGINDTWKITGMENYPNSEITILDRFGTAVLKKIINGTFEWNGQINGRILPTGTYWYVLKVSDGRILQGHVLIKNRN